MNCHLPCSMIGCVLSCEYKKKYPCQRPFLIGFNTYKSHFRLWKYERWGNVWSRTFLSIRNGNEWSQLPLRNEPCIVSRGQWKEKPEVIVYFENVVKRLSPIRQLCYTALGMSENYNCALTSPSTIVDHQPSGNTVLPGCCHIYMFLFQSDPLSSLK